MCFLSVHRGVLVLYISLVLYNAESTSLDTIQLKEMEHVPNIFMSFDKYLFLEVINILI